MYYNGNVRGLQRQSVPTTHEGRKGEGIWLVYRNHNSQGLDTAAAIENWIVLVVKGRDEKRAAHVNETKQWKEGGEREGRCCGVRYVC